MGFLLEIKSWFDDVFDFYLVEESLWGFRVWQVKWRFWFGVVREMEKKEFDGV